MKKIESNMEKKSCFSFIKRFSWGKWLILGMVLATGCGKETPSSEKGSRLPSVNDVEEKTRPDEPEKKERETSLEALSEKFSQETKDSSENRFDEMEETNTTEEISEKTPEENASVLSKENIASFFMKLKEWPRQKDEFETKSTFEKRKLEHSKNPIMGQIFFQDRIVYENPDEPWDIFRYDADLEEAMIHIPSCKLSRYDETYTSPQMTIPEGENYEWLLNTHSSNIDLSKVIRNVERREYYLFLNFRKNFKQAQVRWKMPVEEAKDLKEHLGCRISFELAPEIVEIQDTLSEVCVWKSTRTHCDSHWIPVKKVEIQLYNTRTGKTSPTCSLDQEKWDEEEEEWEPEKKLASRQEDEENEEDAEREVTFDELEEREEGLLIGYSRRSPTSPKKMASQSWEPFSAFDVSLEKITPDTSFISIQNLYESLKENTPFKEEFVTNEDYAQLMRERMREPLEGDFYLDAWMACPLKVEKIFRYDPEREEVLLGIPGFGVNHEYHFWRPGSSQPCECHLEVFFPRKLQFELYFAGIQNPQISIPMPPQDAKNWKENLGCIAVFRLKQDWGETLKTHPWIDIGSICIQDLQLWYYHTETGDVVFKWAVQDWCAEKAEDDPRYAPKGRLPQMAYRPWKIQDKTVWAAFVSVDTKEGKLVLERRNGEQLTCQAEDWEDGEELLENLEWLYKKKMWTFRLAETPEKQMEAVKYLSRRNDKWYTFDFSKLKERRMRARFLYGDEKIAVFYNEQTKQEETYLLGQLGKNDIIYLNKYGPAIGYQIEKAPKKEKEKKRR